MNNRYERLRCINNSNPHGSIGKKVITGLIILSLYALVFSILTQGASAAASASIQSASVDKSTYAPGETVKIKVTIKNTGTVDLSNLKINVDIADPNGNNVIASTLKSGISVSKGKTYSTDYTGYYTLPKDSIAGTYKITVGLWNPDSSTHYDIKYQMASFKVKTPPTPTTPKPTTPKPTTPKPTTPKPNTPKPTTQKSTTPTPPPKILASVQSVSVEKSAYSPEETVKVKVIIKNTGTVDLSDLKINVDIADPNGNNVIASTLKSGISVSKGKTYSTDYTGYYTLPKDPIAGTYKITVSLWNSDNSQKYDIKYRTASFNVKLPPETSAFIQLDGLTYQYNAAQGLYYLNGKKVNSELNELLKILSKHVKKGEKINSIKPVLLDNKYYTIFYFFTSDITDHNGEILSSDVSWASNSIRNTIVIVNNKIETNKEVLKKVYGTALSGYIYTVRFREPGNDDILIHKTLLQDINEITSSPAFIMQGGKSYLSGGSEAVYKKILRELVSQREGQTIPTETVSFLETTLNKADSGINAAKAIDDAIKTGAYSNYPRVRQTMQTMSKNIKNWEYVKTGNNKYLKIGGKKVPWTYASTVFKGAIAITHQQVYEQERIKVLEDILYYSKSNNIKIDPSLEAAMVAVIKEGNDANAQMFNKFVEFVMETAVDKGTDKGIDLSLDAFSKWAFNTLGHNSYLAHSAAGAANQLVLGLTVSNLLYNMDGIYENAIKAEFSQKLAENLDKINDHLRHSDDNSKTYYIPSRAKLYQDTYYFKALAVAHFYDSYGALIDSADFIKFLKDIQFSGGLSKKARDLHQEANNVLMYNYGGLFGTKNIDSVISDSK